MKRDEHVRLREREREIKESGCGKGVFPGAEREIKEREWVFPPAPTPPRFLL